MAAVTPRSQRITKQKINTDLSSEFRLNSSFSLLLGELGHLVAIDLLRRHDAKIAKNDKAKNKHRLIKRVQT
jgi:hypothetical protein